MLRKLIKKHDPANLPGRENPRGYEFEDGRIMSFGDHLEDLRKRVFLSIIGIVPIFAVAFGFGGDLLRLLLEPVQEQLTKAGQGAQLLATGPFETFGVVVQIALIVTVLVGAPWLLYQLWCFISPGLYKHERKIVHLLLPFSGLLTVCSVLFLYYVILPVILAFFIGFGAKVSSETFVPTAPVPEGIVFPMIPVLAADPPDPTPGMVWINEALLQQRVCIGIAEDGNPIIRVLTLTSNIGIAQQYRISEYIKTILNMGLAFGIAFQTPVVVVMLGWVGIINPNLMRRFRKHAIAVSAVLGAVLTPADPLSMLLLAGPLYLLYELGLLILHVLPIERVLGKTSIRDQQDPSAVTDEDAGEG
jgi:Sec-independent protein secretion pathway component TatC